MTKWASIATHSYSEEVGHQSMLNPSNNKTHVHEKWHQLEFFMIAVRIFCPNSCKQYASNEYQAEIKEYKQPHGA